MPQPREHNSSLSDREGFASAALGVFRRVGASFVLNRPRSIEGTYAYSKMHPAGLISDETAQSRGEALFPYQGDQTAVRQLRLQRRRFVLRGLRLLVAPARRLLVPRALLLLLQGLLLGAAVHANAAEAL